MTRQDLLLATLPIFFDMITDIYENFVIFGSSNRDSFVTQTRRLTLGHRVKSQRIVIFSAASLPKT